MALVPFFGQVLVILSMNCGIKNGHRGAPSQMVFIGPFWCSTLDMSVPIRSKPRYCHVHIAKTAHSSNLISALYLCYWCPHRPILLCVCADRAVSNTKLDLSLFFPLYPPPQLWPEPERSLIPGLSGTQWNKNDISIYNQISCTISIM